MQVINFIKINKHNQQKISVKVSKLSNKLIYSIPRFIDQKKFIQDNYSVIQQDIIKYLNYDYRYLYYLGQKYDLVFIQAKEKHIVIDKQIKVYYVKDKIKDLEFLLAKQLEPILQGLVNKYSELFNQTINQFQIKKVRSYWGKNYFNKRILIFNLALIYQSYQFIEKVVIHEFCHFIYTKHNRQFYNLLAFYLPNYQQITASYC